jgi:hypothetical protein
MSDLIEFNGDRLDLCWRPKGCFWRWHPKGKWVGPFATKAAALADAQRVADACEQAAMDEVGAQRRMIYAEARLRRMHANILERVRRDHPGEPLIDGGWHIQVSEDGVVLVSTFYLDMEPGTKPLTIATEFKADASIDA